MEWGRKGLNKSNVGKTQFFSFDCLNNYGVIGVKMDGYVFSKKTPSKMLKLFFSSELD